MMNSTTKNKFNLLTNKCLKIILPVVSIIVLWELLALVIDNEFFMPGVKTTSTALVDIVSSKGFLKIIFTSLLRVLIGIFLGITLGIIIATACHYFSIVEVILSPIISIMKATPVACIIVLLWISMNSSQLAIFVVVMMVMPIIWQNVIDGYRSIDKGLIEVSEVFELSFKKKFKVLIFPTLINYLIPAIITSIGLAWKAEVAAEIMTNSNMGRLIYDFKTVSYDTASIFAWTVIIVALSLLFEKIAKYLLRRLL